MEATLLHSADFRGFWYETLPPRTYDADEVSALLGLICMRYDAQDFQHDNPLFCRDRAKLRRMLLGPAPGEPRGLPRGPIPYQEIIDYHSGQNPLVQETPHTQESQAPLEFSGVTIGPESPDLERKWPTEAEVSPLGARGALLTDKYLGEEDRCSSKNSRSSTERRVIYILILCLLVG